MAYLTDTVVKVNYIAILISTLCSCTRASYQLIILTVYIRTVHDCLCITLAEYARNKSPLLKHISDCAQQLTYMKTMIELLNVDSLTQVGSLRNAILRALGFISALLTSLSVNSLTGCDVMLACLVV